ncbi:hypothetical protein A8713_16280 [Streptomyces sp. SAT1]|uniref:ribosomal protein L7/L12 n=1 Tax=Streptomyces sp. SAT1 TaxID=1849967 RepID=UPI0007DD6A69|nr:ribosomal protein L7/L12 [Streptomyces sp. SAT1]ANH92525.1 hypothetical protein A8713_16280 [Streptomyces sp. SAT1]
MDILVFVIVFAALLTGFATIEIRIARTDRRTARVEHKLDLILDHLGLCEEQPWRGEVAELARTGRKIQAVKLYREATDAGLKEAKEAVDRIAAG